MVLNDKSRLILYKDVDKSVLTDGFNIPPEMQEILYESIGRRLAHGESIRIKVDLGGELFECALNNINFNKNKYPNHPDLLQVRYSKQSPIAKKIRKIFEFTNDFVEKARLNIPKGKHIIIPKENRERFAFYSTPIENTYYIDVVLNSEKIDTLSKKITEEQFESSAELLFDPSATLIEKERMVKIRKIDHSICDNLKKLYDYRCQMTGEKIGDEYGGNVVEAHHIVPFVESLDNDSSNIIIVSPNYHRIIHQTKPRFVRKTLSFHFPNGLIESVKLNKHLLTTKS